MPRATCTGTSERENKERNNKTKQIVGNKIVLRQHAPQRSAVVVRVQPSNKVKSQTLRPWPLPTQRSSTDSSSMPHLSAELLILPLLTPHSHAPHSSLLILSLHTILTSRATRRQLHVPGSRPPFLLDSADFRSILSASSVLSTAPFVIHTSSSRSQFSTHTHDFRSSTDSRRSTQTQNHNHWTGAASEASLIRQLQPDAHHNNWDGTTCSTQDNNKTKLEQGCSILRPTTTNYQQRPTN